MPKRWIASNTRGFAATIVAKKDVNPLNTLKPDAQKVPNVIDLQS